MGSHVVRVKKQTQEVTEREILQEINEIIIEKRQCMKKKKAVSILCEAGKIAGIKSKYCATFQKLGTVVPTKFSASDFN